MYMFKKLIKFMLLEGTFSPLCHMCTEEIASIKEEPSGAFWCWECVAEEYPLTKFTKAEKKEGLNNEKTI